MRLLLSLNGASRTRTLAILRSSFSECNRQNEQYAAPFTVRDSWCCLWGPSLYAYGVPCWEEKGETNRQPANPSFFAGIKSPCKGTFHELGTPPAAKIFAKISAS